MRKIPIDEKDDLNEAILWATFATEPHQQRKHWPTATLYQNEGGFFVIEDSPSPRMVPTMKEPIKDPQEWLDEQVKRLKPVLKS